MASLRSRRPSRRWLPLLTLVVSFAVAFSVFPNPLRVPTNNPNATAELAPVPGKQQTSRQANFSETNLPSSGGLGSFGGTGGVLPPPPPLQGQVVPVQKHCVGDPPRQTEDPLSPPCVPFFAGDNGGKTFTGVTGNEIKVVLYNDFGTKGDMSTPYSPSDETGNCHAPPNEEQFDCPNWVRTVKAQLRYFQQRFQTYGRRVHVYAQPSAEYTNTTAEERRQDALLTKSEFNPFAAVFLGVQAQDYFAKLAQLGIPSFGLSQDVPRKFYEQYAPYIWSFLPDQETEARWSAAFLCRKLQGRPARLSTDPSLRNRTRRFGLIWGTNNVLRGPAVEQVAALLKAEAKRQCGLEFEEATFDASNPFVEGASEAPGIMARMKLDNVTTIVCYCLTFYPEVTAARMKNAATSAQYFPEWYWDSVSSMDLPQFEQTFGQGDARQRSFGSSLYWRAPAYQQQYDYQAYLSQEPGSTPNPRFNFTIYHTFLNLFTAIQAAGPELTPSSVERGMFTFKSTDVTNPWLPAGGYGPDGPGTYTFDDTAMGWWWDPAGTPPGGTPGEGCLRVIDRGRRFYWHQWFPGDSDLFLPTDPCSEGLQRFVND